jgi:tRNA nucleotidyltransferase/poly(A) polymerase
LQSTLAEHNVTTAAQVISWLAQQSVAAYLVGGCVRDRLLGRPLYDLDVVTGADGLDLARRLADDLRGAYHALDPERGTGRAILGDRRGHQLVVDLARFRQPEPLPLPSEVVDRASSPAPESLALDLAGRDFTINAMAADVRAPELVIDPYRGQSDLAAGLIRAVSNQSIRDDPVRALRALRLAGELGFELTSETEVLIQRDGPGLGCVSAERVRDELARILILPQAATYLMRLDDLRLLTVVFPELEALRDLKQPSPHYLDVLGHSLRIVKALEVILLELRVVDIPPGVSQVVEFTEARPWLDGLGRFSDRLRPHVYQHLAQQRPRLVTLKLAALLHDTGKAAAQTIEEGGRIRFLGHEADSARAVGRILRRLRFNRAEVQVGETIARHHMRPLLIVGQASVSPRAVYRFWRDTRDAGIDVLLHALADHRATYPPGKGDERWSQLLALTVRMLADYWERQEERVDPPSLVDGYDLMQEFALEPGPQIGALLELVREAQIAGEVETRAEALGLVRSRLDPLSQ